jgi:hypothetical protein
VNRPRLRAPQDDGQILVDPPLLAVESLIERNRSRLNSKSKVFVRELGDFRKQTISEITAAARAEHLANGEPIPSHVADSLFLVGHQPELYHPGVWLKNFALGSLATRHGATGLNVIVDSDTVRHTAISVPVWDADPANVHRINVAFDSLGSTVPHEERTIHDEELFAELPNVVKSHTSNWPQQSMLGEFWSEVMRQRKRTPILGEAIAAARRAMERRWGTHNLEVRLSTICRTAAFGEFAVGILGTLPEFHEAYNSAVRGYRRRHHIRNAQHPVPDLARDGDWLEAPFWAWRSDSPRRERLFVRQTAGRLELRAGGQPWPDLPTGAKSIVWQRLERDGFKVRTRALTTTLFSRLVVADLFIHGIGGGKYDEITDELMRRFFGIEPPTFLVVTGTLQLPLPRFGGAVAALKAAQREVRDLDWNPQRHLNGGDWLAKHAALRAERPTNQHDKRMRFAAFRALNERLRPLVAKDRMVAAQILDRLQKEVAANEILRARDYAFVLYSESLLREFLLQFQRNL